MVAVGGREWDYVYELGARRTACHLPRQGCGEKEKGQGGGGGCGLVNVAKLFWKCGGVSPGAISPSV